MSSSPSARRRRRGLAGFVSLIAVSVLCLAVASSASALPIPPGGGGSSQPGGPSSRCSGYTDSTLPASGDLVDPSSSSTAGFFDSGGYTVTSRGEPNSAVVCIRTVREWVHYTMTATKTWQVYINGHFAAQVTFRLEPGYYFWDFTIDKDYVQPNRVCILASGTPGHSCFGFTYLS